MKKTSLPKLIELARLAPKVEPKLIGQEEDDLEYSNISDFFGDLDLRGGKNEVKTSDLFKIYRQWDKTDTGYKKFRKDLKEICSFSKKRDKVKLSKKIITIEETYKDLYAKKDEEE